MLFNSALISTLFLACSAVAYRPLKHQKPRIVERSTNAVSGFSHNEAGASLTGATFSSITGTFVTPVSVTGQSDSALLIYVSLSCQDYLFLAGVQYTVTKNGIDHQASLLWPPDLNDDPESISVSPHDKIELFVNGTTKTGGLLRVKNLTTGEDRHLTYEASSLDCGAQTASWMVQNVTNNALPDFGTVSIQGHVAGGEQTMLEDGSHVDIQGVTETSVSGDTVTVRYL